jgi:hypothetical protein
LKSNTTPAGLNDSCDPDDDNDGVPDTLDCEPNNANAHPSYQIPPHDGLGAILISAAPEVCDHIDNDCDGKTDDLVTFAGHVENARNGQPLNKAGFKIMCGGNKVASGLSDASGNYNLTVKMTASCTGPFTISGESNSEVCADSDATNTHTVSAPPGGAGCALINFPNLTLVPRPGSSASPGVIATAFIQWAPVPGLDIDFYVQDATRKVGFIHNYNGAGAPTYNGSPRNMGEVVFDIDNQSGPGPETISFSGFQGGAHYRFYANLYAADAGNRWGPKPGQYADVKFKMFDSSCTETLKYLTLIGGAHDDYLPPKPWWEIATFDVNGNSISKGYDKCENSYLDGEPAAPPADASGNCQSQ